MKDEILAYLSNPRQLEKLYRDDKGHFKREFSRLYPTIKGNTIADAWNERLNFEGDEIKWGANGELIFVIIVSVLAGLIAKLPDIFAIDDEFFYTRNAGFIVFPALCAYFGWKNRLRGAKVAIIVGTIVLGLIFINSLPVAAYSDTIMLSCIHLLLFLWVVLGFSFIDNKGNSVQQRLGYLRYNGDLIVMTTLIVIAGAILTAVTIGLFSLIGFAIEEFYLRYIIIFCLPAAPILGTYLVDTNPQLVGKVSPVIAKIFSPLVLAMLVIYLVAIIISGKDPYNDREFLMVFNALLVGVMAIIFFSIAETSATKAKPAGTFVLFLLSVVTIVVNGVALSAIIFRISEWGITPNRAAVLGGNVLILINLVLVTTQLFRVVSGKGAINGVGRAIAVFLPIYCLWAIVVTFLFPFIFGFR